MMDRRMFIAGAVSLLAAPLAAKGQRYLEGRTTGRLVLLP
jgi:hypothetical protein